VSTWQTEGEEALEYQIKAHLVLEGSNDHEWGVVKDCHGCVNYIPEDAEVVGTWNKYAGGFWVSLETPITALVDKATQLYVELAEKRRMVVIQAGRKPPTIVTDTSAFSDLRAKLKGGM